MTAVPSDQQPDRHRPQYHFLPPSNWMNDPNGLIQWGNTYHLFYQYNPHGPFHGTIHWGHAASSDLVHWEHLPIALAPSPGGPDEDGCWSGCAVNNNGVPTLVYSGASAIGQRACIATSNDGLLTWQKHAANPVIAATPEGLTLVEFRDHSIWREDGMWYQVIGSGLHGQGGTALLYRSADLYSWEFVHPLVVGDFSRREPIWTGSLWECPDFFALGDRHALTISVWDAYTLHGSAAMVGRYQDHRFVPEVEHVLDYGNEHFYAPQSFTDNAGRRIIFGWVQEGRSMAAQEASGWSGIMSLPRMLSLGADGQVVMQPVPEVEGLRGEHTHHEGIDAAGGALVELPGVAGDSLELLAELLPAPNGVCGLVLRRSPDGAEQTVLRYDTSEQILVLDRSRSSLDETVASTAHTAPLALSPGEPLRLRVFLDRSVIEVFANDQVSLTSRIYPTRPDSTGIALWAEGGDVQLVRLDSWQIGSVW